MPEGANEAVYEMIWDCKFCGQKKLLGLTHRFCAGCGAPQDPASRYFPPDSEKVAVHDHEFSLHSRRRRRVAFRATPRGLDPGA
jgi:hypothetical protein